MKFDWDDEKARTNELKHGVAFDVAIKVFDDPNAISGLDRVVDGEMLAHRREDWLHHHSFRRPHLGR